MAPSPPDFLVQWEHGRARIGSAAPALIDARHVLSHAQLDMATDVAGQWLVQRGVGPETIVGLDIRAPIAIVIAMIACIKAGGAFLVADRRAAGGPQAALWLDDEDGRAWTREAIRTPPGDAAGRLQWRRHLVAPRQLAYVLRTSGSTGTPKAAMIERANFAAFVLGVRRALRLRRSDCWMQLAPPTFDVFLEEVFPVLASGGSVRLRLDPEPLDFVRFHKEIAAGATIAEVTTRYFYEYLAWLGSSGRTVPRPLRMLVVGGEKMDAQAFRAWQDRHRAALVHVYGITETTVTSSLHCSGAGKEPGAGIPLGMPIAGARLELAGPAGGVGEILIGGAGVGRGYADDPRRTAHRFRPDPAGPAGARRYHSGDLALRSPDGELLFQSRGDLEVKILGRRLDIELIERAIRSGAAVSDCAVVATSSPPARIAAFVVPIEAQPAGALRREVLALLSAELSDWSVPLSAHVVDALPKTEHGKLDRTRLAATAAALRPTRSQPPRRTCDARLKTIVGAFATALNLEQIGADDDFFEIGGDSLSALAIISAIDEQGSLDLSISDLFDHPTPNRLYQRIISLHSTSETP